MKLKREYEQDFHHYFATQRESLPATVNIP